MTQSSPDQPPLILVADDDRTMRSLLNLAMEEEGYRIAEANNGEQCLSEYVHFRPDLVLLDAVMPDLDGFTCCQRLRKLPGGDRIPILMITVLDDRESVEQAFNAGATDYVTKPIHWEVLSQRVRRLLRADRAWLETEALKAQLHQQQAWEALMRKVLQQLQNEAIASWVATIREGLDLSRVWLYHSETQNWVESVAPGLPAMKESRFDFNFFEEDGEYYQQGNPVVIKNLVQANFPHPVIEQMQQLNTQALLIVPMQVGERLIGWLIVHSAQAEPQWNETRLHRFSDLANLLAIRLA